MRKRVSREAALPSFHVSLEELDVLVEKMRSVLRGSGPGAIETEITVDVGGDGISFQGVNEMRGSDELPKRALKFWVEVYCENVQIRLDSRYEEAGAAIYVRGESSGWCAGAIEEIRSYLNRRRAWYWWFRGFPLGALVWTPLVIAAALEKIWDVKVGSTGIGSAMAVAFVLYVSRPAVFPNGVIELHFDDHWVRRYSLEIALVVSVLGLIVSIAQVFR